jgi:hypothetical protein
MSAEGYKVQVVIMHPATLSQYLREIKNLYQLPQERNYFNREAAYNGIRIYESQKVPIGDILVF